MIVGRLCPILNVKSKAFVRQLRRYSRKRGLDFEYDPRAGKGSHGRVYLDTRLTTVKHGEIGPGLVRKMLRDLGVDPEEF